MEQEIWDKDQAPLVVHSNLINKAAFRLSVPEIRIILTAITQLSRDGSVSEMGRWHYVTTQDLQDYFEADNASRDIRKAHETLFSRYIIIPDPDVRDGVIKTRWIQAMKFKKGDGRIGILFAEPLIPYLILLKENFTKFPLDDITDLSSEYAIRIYMWLCQFRTTGWVRIDIEELRSILELGSKYKSITLFAQHVLAVACDQINNSKKTSFKNVSYELIKVGRAYKAVRISFDLKETEEQIKKKARLELSHKQLWTFASKLVKNDSVWRKFYTRFHQQGGRENGLDLIGVNNEQISIKKTVDFLSVPENAALALPFLEEVGFNPQKPKIKNRFNKDDGKFSEPLTEEEVAARDERIAKYLKEHPEKLSEMIDGDFLSYIEEIRKNKKFNEG
ncbi:replication initiation protein [Sutterella sp.]|uniref:replication initiation protein n=1 Tax=Sutterella sp. TaxID=1981025 RepID=UPI0026E05526|nr:replication initiation protein [Sutterella sp.]MDO5532263.1 replication initiation protein [Sutterella sp.]